MNNPDKITGLLLILLVVMVLILMVLAVVYVVLKLKSKKKEDEDNTSNKKTVSDAKKIAKEYTKDSIFKFMEFDKIEDNMIVQKNGNRYLMVVECQGVNYDLMSEAEKISVEEGFLQFLNTLRHPIQIYIQTRTVNLTDSIDNYKKKVNEIEIALENKKNEYTRKVQSGRYSKEQLEKEFYEVTKQTNLYEYGKDIIENTQKMSLNKNVLNKKYYIVIPYYPEDLGSNSFDKGEIKNLAFSELYTKSQSIIRTMAACEVGGRIMTSNDLVELLYTAYNRDEAEIFTVDRALRSGYDELYTTAPDVLDKKMKELNMEIEKQALSLVNDKVLQVKSKKQKEIEQKQSRFGELIRQRAEMILKQNAGYLGEDVSEEAIDMIKEEEKPKTEEQEEKPKRKRKTTSTVKKEQTKETKTSKKTAKEKEEKVKKNTRKTKEKGGDSNVEQKAKKGTNARKPKATK